MNIADRVKRLKRVEKMAQKARFKQYEEEDKKEQRFKNRVVSALKKSSINSLNKTKQLRVTWNDRPLIFGELATIEQKVTFGRGVKAEWYYVGTVCFKNESYEFQGSDESPVQTFYRPTISFRQIVNHDDAEFAVQVDREDIKESIKEFEDDLVAYIHRKNLL